MSGCCTRFLYLNKISLALQKLFRNSEGARLRLVVPQPSMPALIQHLYER